MIFVSSMAMTFLAVSLVIYFYETFYKIGPVGKGVRDGTLAASLYLFAVHHFFVAGTIWLGVVSFIVATLLVINALL